MFDINAYPYPSQRFVKYAKKGMCATSRHLAANAGLDMLKRGGNAIDAAVAAAMCLTVLEPESNGIGSDAFALVWSGGKLHGLNASGFSPAALSVDAVQAKGHAEMPRHGLLPVTVPGAPSAWAALSERFGKLPLTAVAAPAIDYAANGFACSPMYQQHVELFADRIKPCGGDVFRPWYDTFMPGGRGPRTGETVTNSDAAGTLERIAATKAEAFYRGDLAEQIGAFSAKHGGFLTAEDLAAYWPEWVEPIGTGYHGYEVWEIPPNGQGIVALMALNILDGFEPFCRDDVESIHRQIEAIKIAFADGHRYIADPRHMKVTVQDLLSKAYGEQRRREIGKRASEPMPGSFRDSGTVYLCAADDEGNMVSFIQSNYMGYGSGVVIPGTGISLQNRGHNFSMEKGHANEAAGRKKPYHTIIPGFLTKDGEAVGPFGVMGGFMQPQGHVQVMANYIDCGLNPQSCIDAPRWCWQEGLKVAVEKSYPQYLMDGLADRGHGIYHEEVSMFGRSQMIFRTGASALMGGTESRCEGECAAW